MSALMSRSDKSTGEGYLSRKSVPHEPHWVSPFRTRTPHTGHGRLFKRFDAQAPARNGIPIAQSRPKTISPDNPFPVSIQTQTDMSITTNMYQSLAVVFRAICPPFLIAVYSINLTVAADNLSPRAMRAAWPAQIIQLSLPLQPQFAG